MIDIIIYLVIPIILIPNSIRLVLIPIVGMFARAIYLPKRFRKLDADLSQPVEHERMAAILRLVKQKVRPFGLLRPKFMQDIGDIIAVAAGDQGERISGSGDSAGLDQLQLACALLPLLQSAYLLFEDLYDDYQKKWWFRFALSFRVGWYIHLSISWRFFQRILSHKILQGLRHGRILARTVRVLLIPVFGLPDLVLSVVFSLTIGLMSEAIFRYAYAVILLKTGFYATHLFSADSKQKKTSVIYEGIEARASSRAELIRELIRTGSTKRSSRFSDAVCEYVLFLDEQKLHADARFTGDTSRRVRAFLKKGFRTGRHIFVGRKQDDLQAMRALLNRISAVYAPNIDQFWNRLRGRELLAAGYAGSSLVLEQLNEPLIRRSIGQVRLSFLLPVGKLLMNERNRKVFKTTATQVGKLSRSYRYFSLAKSVGKLIMFKQPAGLIAFVAWHGVRQSLVDTYRSQLYHLIGRLSLYIWECNAANHSPMKDIFSTDP
ncbi:hypothetical protein [Spirochaeta dissipatitropha]